MAGQVFLSYSRKDWCWREELLPSLRAVVKDRIWFDEQGIDVGDEFHPKIQQAMAEAGIALLLVSNHFLTSGYIRQHELPFLLRRYKMGSARLGILYLTSIADEALGIDFDVDGRPTSLQLTKIHSFNTLQQPLDRIRSEGERKKIYATVATWLAQRLSPPPPPAPPPPASHVHDAHRPALAICISARNDHWQHAFYLRARPDAMRPALDCDPPSHVDAENLDGEGLFALLFGRDPELAGNLLAAAFDTGRSADPTYAPLRLHLITGDRMLQALPWNEIAHRGRPLREHGWTVELHAHTAGARAGFPAQPGAIESATVDQAACWPLDCQ